MSVGASLQAADGPYYWLLEQLSLYKPVTWEYSRCAIAGAVLSKRLLQVSEQRWNNFKRFKYFYLKAKARIWP